MKQVMKTFLAESSNYLHNLIIEQINTNTTANSNEINKFQSYLKYTISISIFDYNKKHSIEYPNVDNGFPIT